MSDLVKYLRAHMAPDRPCKRTEQDIACGQAAAELESLRSQLAAAVALLREICEKAKPIHAKASRYEVGGYVKDFIVPPYVLSHANAFLAKHKEQQ